MPFIEVHALPFEFLDDRDFLEKLEVALIAGLADAIGVNEGICHVDFIVSAPRKLLPNHLVWVYVGSGVFEGVTPEVSALKLRATDVVGRIIKVALHNRFNVEAIPVALDGKHMAYFKAT